MILYRLFIIVGGAIVVVLFTALIAPMFIDWTNYKRSFEREASRIAGQPVTVGGTASVRLLPLPTITFTDLSVGRYDDGTPMMTVDAFSMDTELMPFLRGQVRIVDMRLIRPRLMVRVNENGTVDWTVRRELLVDPENVKIEQLRVEDGAVRLEGLAGGRVLTASGMDADISARSLYGPWRIEAQGLVEGRDATIGISTGRLQESGAIRLRVTAERRGFDYRVTMDGPLALDDGVLGWNGEFGIVPLAEALAAERALPVHAEGRYAATPTRVDIAEYRMEVGDRADPYVVTGTAGANIREAIFLRATADGRQIDLDRLPAPEAGGTTPPAGLQQRIGVLKELVDRIPVPAASGEIDLLLPAIVAGDTVIRDLKARIQPDGDGWRIASLETVFPGDTTVEANGRLGIGEDFGFTGRLLLASRQPTGFASWLSGGSSAALRRLRSAGFEAYATLTLNQATLENLEMVLDGVRLTGKLQRLAPAGKRPALIARLAGARIDIDELLALYSLAGGDAGGGLAAHDVDLMLEADLLQGQGLSAGQVEARLRFEEGSISVDALKAEDFYGTRVESSGRLDDLLDRPSGNLTLRVDGEDASRLAAMAAERIGPNPFFLALAGDRELSRDVSLTLEVESRPVEGGSRGALALRGRIGGTQVQIANRFEGSPRQWRGLANDLSFAFQQDSPLLLARQLALPVLPFDAPGPISLKGDLAGSLEAGARLTLSANAPQTDLVLDGMMTAGEEGTVPQFDVAATLGSQDIEPWLLIAGYPLPGGGTGAPASLSARLVGDGGTYRAGEMNGQYDGIGFSGNVTLQSDAQPRPRLSGDFAFDLVSAAFVGEMAVGAGTLTGDGETLFGAALLQGFDGSLQLSGKTLDLGTGPMARDFSGELTLADGRLSLGGAEARWLDGQLSGNVALRDTGEGMLANLQLRLDDADLGALAALSGHAPLVTGRGSVSATVDGTGRSARALTASLAGSGVMEVERLRLSGIRTSGLETVLAETDVEDFEIATETVAPLAENAFLDGAFETGPLSLPFTVNNGEISIANIAASDEGGALRAELGYALEDGQTRLAVTVEPDPGKEALAGAEPGVVFRFEGEPGAMALSTTTTALEGYLSLRAFEREQRRVEMLQAAVLEKQRLRREVIQTNARMAWREVRRAEQARQLEALQSSFEDEVERRRAREEAREAAIEQARLEAERERQEAERKRREEEERKRREEEERKQREAEQARLEAERARQAAEEAARRAAEAERARQAEAERQARQAELERRQRAAQDRQNRNAPATDQEPIDLFRSLNELFGIQVDR